MPRFRFFIYNVVGALLWVTSVTLLGYWLGSKIPDIDKYLLPVILLATVFTFGPPLLHVWRDKRKNKQPKD
jgi:membrane-associated protein